MTATFEEARDIEQRALEEALRLVEAEGLTDKEMILWLDGYVRAGSHWKIDA